MTTSDTKRHALLLDCADAYGQVLTAERLATYSRLLADVDPGDLGRALDIHLTTCRFFPTVAEIRERLPRATATHLPADTAWAIALTASDETETVIWTDEIAQALDAARPVLESGDKVGARMAFKGAYERLTATGGHPVYRVSVGHDPEKRAASLEKAQRMGLLTAQQAAHYLPAPPANPLMTAAVSGLLAGNVVAFKGQKPDPKENIAKLRALLEAKAKETAPKPERTALGPDEMESTLRRLEGARSDLLRKACVGTTHAQQEDCSASQVAK